MDALAVSGLQLSPVKDFDQIVEIRAEKHAHLRGRNNVTSCRSPTRENTKLIKNELKEKRHQEFLRRRSLEDVVTWIGYFCFTSNPFFYGCLNRQIREELSRHLACLFKRAGPSEGEQLPSREASIEENFLQFLQGTGCNLEPCNSHSPEEPETEDLQESAVQQNTPADFHIPGQILEETSEFIQRQQLNNELHVSENCCKTVPEL
ncbi:putative G-protein coupled receptor 61 Biogenic amine receptor-like G-protein coupled receptor [Larimichthys crocea]|uniref:Putative G-protein coupled receptor 61 Biogenic amine receptor-like G-protein coupled receptor n=1 Tax=Larimichthys crocea TaxID=215358 RepID=A0A6G0IPL5_LARCR|nr:putative G-protein coupled receptor 61 Biogenic amine receptor-like G-protein coupled receptor [Larimichthys crocea]